MTMDDLPQKLVKLAENLKKKKKKHFKEELAKVNHCVGELENKIKTVRKKLQF